MKLEERDQKDHGKTLIIFSIILSILVIIAGAFAIYQTTKVGQLKASIVKKNQVIAAASEVIVGLKANVIKLKNDMGAMALQAANDQKEIKALKHSRSEFTVIAAWLIAIRDECLNYCDGKFVPGMLKGLKEFEALIDQLAKTKAEK